ncbi:MAG: hypothetical protein KC486_22145 [Myxococcales bacterium]|nr:hypothetical protein [Myxococcales bacterium]
MRINSLIIVGVALAMSGGCAKRQLNKMDAQEDKLAAQYDGSSYEEDMVQADASQEYEDQGDSISPEALAGIQDTITNVYERDFGRCLQEDMDAYNNRWIAGTFAVEFRINTKGKVTEVSLLEEDIKEIKLPPGQKEPRKAKLFGPCIERAIYKWEFEKPPEVEYVHTYTGQVGEAF